MLVTQAEQDWLRERVMPYLGIKKLRLTEDLKAEGKYPDIWAQGDIVTVTREWARQSPGERKKRLFHEALHVAGLPHMPGRGFYSKPGKDVYTPRVMAMMEKDIPFRA